MVLTKKFLKKDNQSSKKQHSLKPEIIVIEL